MREKLTSHKKGLVESRLQTVLLFRNYLHDECPFVFTVLVL